MQQHIFPFVGELDELQPKFRFSEFALRAETGASYGFEAPLRGWPRHRATDEIVPRSMGESAAPDAADFEVATTRLRNLGQNNPLLPTSSHFSSVQERLVNGPTGRCPLLPHDEAEAARWYKKGAEAGDDLGMNNLAVMYENGRGGLPRDKTEAVRWYQRAAEAGNTDALEALRRLGR